MDRLLQKVSLTAGREKDGPYETRLFTSLDRVEPQPPTTPPGPDGYAAEEARAEAGRCLQCQCLECVKVCAYLERFKAYPKKYAREIYNNESIVAGTRQANRLINSCSLCGLCQAVCPEDFAMQDLCLEARRSMVRRGKMPPSAHEFALQDMAFSQSERFYLTRPEPGRSDGAWVFFPGCQLCATRPGQAARVYDHLRQSLDGGVGLMLGCCGAPAHWAARDDLFQETLGRFRRSWDDLGRPKIVAACSTCMQMLTEHLPETGPVHLAEIMMDADPLELKYTPPGPLAVHDPCTTRGRDDVQDAVAAGVEPGRSALRGTGTGAEPDRMLWFRGADAERQSGPGPGSVRPAGGAERNRLSGLLRHVPRQPGRGRQAGGPSARPFLPGRKRRPGRIPPGGLVRTPGKPVPPQGTPAAGSVGRSLGRGPGTRGHQTYHEPEVAELLQVRRILIEDAQKVLLHAQKTGDCFYHPETGRYKASFRPHSATFWIEYVPRDGAFEVFNAYAHRMVVVGGGRS